jgi:hypothetical protein
MEPTVASGAYGVESLGGGPAKASTLSPAYKPGFTFSLRLSYNVSEVTASIIRNCIKIVIKDG